VAENPKNINKFTEEEREEVEDILVRIVREIQKFLDKHNNPKEHAVKILRNSESKTMIASAFLVLCSLQMESDDNANSKKLREKIPEEFRPRSNLMNDALNNVSEEGYFTRGKGEKEIKHPGRPMRGENVSYGRGGGRPSSTYQITEDLEKLKKLIFSPEAGKLIHDRLVKSGLIQEYFKFMILTFCYAMREKSKSAGNSPELFKEIAPYISSIFAENDFFNGWNDFVTLLSSIDESGLDPLANQFVLFVIEQKPLDNLLANLAYLLKALPRE
jgi:hypothetical protein